MISKITRTDTALIQYAMQAFGTTNLSEEDWKKAEDHYKVINIEAKLICTGNKHLNKDD